MLDRPSEKPIRRRDGLDMLVRASPASSAATLRRAGIAARLSLRCRDADGTRLAGGAFGTALPVPINAIESGGGRMAIRLGPDEWLLTSEADEAADIAARVREALAGHIHSLVDVSHRSVTIAIEGPGAADALAAGCPLDLDGPAFPAGMATRTVLGKAEIVLARISDDAFLIDVWRSFAGYVWLFLENARHD